MAFDEIRKKLVDSLYVLNILTLVRKNQEGQNLDSLIRTIKSERAGQPFENRLGLVRTVLRCRFLDIVGIALDNGEVKVTIEDTDPGQISPYPWIGDISHNLLHGSLSSAFEVLKENNAGNEISSTLAKIKSISLSSQLLSLLPVMISPARYQRDNRLLVPHTNEKGEPCNMQGFFQGEGYLEDGNHRAFAQLFAGRDKVRVFKIIFPADYRFPGEV